MRNFKTLALALIAAFAISAMVTSTASAVQFHSAEEETHLAGGQEETHELVVNTGVVVCEEASFTGVQEEKTDN